MPYYSLEAIPHFLRLSDGIGTAGQPNAEQLAIIKEAGYQVVVNLKTVWYSTPKSNENGNMTEIPFTAGKFRIAYSV